MMTKNKPSLEKLAEEIAEVRKACEEMVQNLRNELNDKITAARGVLDAQSGDVPQITPREHGRKERRLYGKIGTTTDAILAQMFEEEARRRSISSGRLLDEILWRNYGRPKLSYELPDDEYEALESKIKKRRQKRR